jgi:serine/threonine-protein kinase
MKECTLCGRCLADHHDVCPDDRAALRQAFDGPPLLDRKYRLIARLGAGGMGTVYEAHHLGLERRVAVKLLHPGRRSEPGNRERFQGEARALARLDHPNIVRIADFGYDGDRGVPYLVMERLAATSLAERLRAGPLPVAAALPLLAQIAAALDHAHAAGILHRDLKASNVLLLGKPDAVPVAKVVDFGLADFLGDPEATPPGRGVPPPWEEVVGEGGRPGGGWLPGPLLGTPAYLAPELWEGRPPSPASDLWAFGVLSFFTLAGRLPFPGPDPAEIREQIARGAPRPSALCPALDPTLDAAILAPLQPDPAARPARAGELIGEMERARLGVRRRLWRQREVPRRLALAGLLGALSLLAQSPLARLLQPLEGLLVDARFHLASPRPPRPEPLLVLIDDATLASDPASLATKAGEAGALLERAFAAGARGIAVDLLLHPSWGDSPAFSDLVLHHPDALVLAAASPAGKPVVGPEAIQGLTAAALGPVRGRELFGFVDLEEDWDGVVRRARPLLRDTTGQVRPSFAARAARLLRPGLPLAEDEVWIDGTVDWRGFERLSFRDLADALDRDAGGFRGRFRGRLLLLGADYAASGDESYRVPHAGELPETLPGTLLQALLLDTLLDGTPVRSPERVAVLTALFLLAAGVSASALLARRSLAAGAAPLAAGAWVAAAFVLFAARRLLLPVAAPVVFLLLVAGLALALRKRFISYP